MTTTQMFNDFEIIDIYTQEQALVDGLLIKVGTLKPNNLPVLFTSNLFADVKEKCKEIIEKGIQLLSKQDDEDSPYMKLRIIQKNKIWVIANSEGVTFMKPEDY